MLSDFFFVTNIILIKIDITLIIRCQKEVIFITFKISKSILADFFFYGSFLEVNLVTIYPRKSFDSVKT